jgi:hypothetical protein
MQSLPDNHPYLTQDIVTAWLRQTSRTQLHDAGWVELNKRAHAIALGAREYANKHYDFHQSPEEREAFFDGVTFGVLLQLHGQDIAQLRDLLMKSRG